MPWRGQPLITLVPRSRTSLHVALTDVSVPLQDNEQYTPKLYRLDTTNPEYIRKYIQLEDE
jgi:hypothetical protein